MYSFTPYRCCRMLKGHEGRCLTDYQMTGQFYTSPRDVVVTTPQHPIIARFPKLIVPLFLLGSTLKLVET